MIYLRIFSKLISSHLPYSLHVSVICSSIFTYFCRLHKSHGKVIGIHGLNNRNKKRRNLLGVFNANNLRVVNILFKKQNYTTWRSFCDKKSPHMLDIITCSTSFFKCVKYCGAVPDGVRSDHSAVRMVFINRSIQFKSNFIERPIIDWKSIQRIPELNDKSNLILHGKLRKAHNYTEFDEAILDSGE